MGFLEKELQPAEKILYKTKHYFLAPLFGMGDGNSYVGSRYYVTNKRLLFRYGWFFPSSQSISLRKIEVVKPIQTWYQKLFGVGQIEIYGIGTTKHHFKRIKDPQAFYRAYQNAEANS